MTGLPVVLLHGIGGGARGFAPEVSALSAQGFRCLAWDQPGYGDSPLPPAEDWATVVAAFIGFLDGQGLDRVALVGHSMGGMLAQEVVATHPARVGRLVLAGTSPAFGGDSDAWRQKFLAERLAPLDAGQGMAALAPALVTGMVGDHPDQDGVARAVACMAAVPEATYRTSLVLLTRFDRRADLARIAVPTLVLAGEKDRNAAPSVMRRMAQAIPDAAYVELAGCGHLMSFDQPAAFLAALVDFLHGTGEM